jgi:hypothetical protein
MKRWLLLLLWLLSLIVPCWARPLCAEFQLRRHTVVDGQATFGEPQTVKVVLADDYLEFQDNDGRVVHDFTTMQSHLVSGDDYVRRSLYADIGFRVAELRNRMGLLESLQKAGSPQAVEALGQIVMVEHLFGIDDETTEANIVKTEGNSLSYAYEGRVLAEFATKGAPLTPAQSKAYARFLRYYCGGHPDILADLRGRNTLPEDVMIEVTNVNEKITYRLHLEKLEECDPPRPDFSALHPTVLPPEPLGTLVAMALQLSPQAVQAARAAVRTRAEQALAEGHTLEAALRCFESYLMEGEQPPKMLAEERATFEADPDTKALFDALTLGAQEPKKAEEILKGLQSKAGQAAHVLKIFRAGFLLPQRQVVEARNLYLEALLANPAIAGAWKDLGDIYHTNFETDTAWLCWDAGRKLAPRHQMLQDIDKLEKVLRSNYPGFF